MFRLVLLRLLCLRGHLHRRCRLRIQQPDSMITQVLAACGVGMTRVTASACPGPQNVMLAGTMEWKHLRAVSMRLSKILVIALL